MNESGYIKNITTGFVILLFTLLSFNTYANEKEMRRIMVGLKLFPAVVSADNLLTEKINNEGFLPLYILYHDRLKLANDLAERLSRIKQIKNIPIKVKAVTFEKFISKETSSQIAAFIAQPLNSNTIPVLESAITSSTLLFSPFKGDVEKGIHSGFIVSDHIRPYVNLKTLHQSRIKLKAFFLRVSKNYD